MSSAALFFYFLNLLLLAPLVFLTRAIFPSPRALRLILVVIGLCALFWAAPRFVLFFVGYWAVIWILQFMMESASRSTKRPAFALTTGVILLALSPMLFWKAQPGVFLPWMTTIFSRAFWEMFPQLGYADALTGLVEPLGLSFTTFRALDLLIKVRLGLLSRLGLERVLFFGLFPPVLALGPIIEYEEIRTEKPLPRAPLPGDLAVGAFRFGLGCVKIFVLAFALNRVAAELWQGGAGTTWQVWGGLIAFGVYFYLNFSGFSDLAIGIARIYGFRLKENFDNPYFKTNPQAFWNSWHMSLTRWVQRYVFIPLGGMRPRHQYFAIFITIMAIALWHAISWPLVVFGVYHGIIMAIYRWLRQRKPSGLQMPKTFWAKSLQMSVEGVKMLAVFLYVAVSLPLLSLPTAEIWPFYRLLIPGLH